MTIREQILAFLQEHPEGIDDDELSEALRLKQRQQANNRCRKLEKEGLVIRRHVNGKIHNFWVGDKLALPTQSQAIPSSKVARSAELWFWEGNVQAAVVRLLVRQNCIIRSVADTASKQRGKDIVAERNGKPLWVTVKGYPNGTPKTPPSTQAGHWFKQALFDIIEYRGESEIAEIGMALPDFPRYRKLAEKVIWLQPVAKFIYYWVQENGEVVEL
jgi:hypothetical protein